jgi:hypothetical protein
MGELEANVPFGFYTGLTFKRNVVFGPSDKSDFNKMFNGCFKSVYTCAQGRHQCFALRLAEPAATIMQTVQVNPMGKGMPVFAAVAASLLGKKVNKTKRNPKRFFYGGLHLLLYMLGGLTLMRFN